ncbi:unnamed protein product [Symbiodinium natans]|uniref:Uncharacterized protein n=1 Tax=Symbiodinium natans TaxID=878477 RepID=A0A812JT18_9DINO|nr:unnamed protein product [Symbiodinium natans]
MAGLSARDYGGGLATKGWEGRATQDVSLTKDDGFDEEVAQAAGITDEDPNQDLLKQRAKEGRARANELAEFAKLQESQKKEAASKAGLASLVAERAAAKNTKRELPSFLKVGGAKSQTPEPEAKRPKNEEAPQAPKASEATANEGPAAGGIGGLGGYESDDSEEDD